jgi:prolyl-tRNA synthetase
MASVSVNYKRSEESPRALEKVETKNQKTITEVSQYLNVIAEKCIKSLVFKIDDQFALVLVRGDHEVNDIKLKNLFEAGEVALASPEETIEILSCSVGSLGPIGVKNVEIVADYAIEAIVNGVCGANKEDYHYVNVNPSRDFEVSRFADLRFIQEGDPSPDGSGTIVFAKGIEVGHVFKLGTRYSEAMNAVYLDENGRSKPMIMGCYGIGVSRTVAAVAEQFNDDKGLVWPANIAPYQLHLIAVNMKDASQAELSESLYKELQSNRFEVLFDDRQERPGVKFADSDLIGLPIRVTVGKKASEGIVEVKIRKTSEVIEVHQNELIGKITSIIESL